MLHLNAHCGFRRRRGEDSKCLPFQDGQAQRRSFAQRSDGASKGGWSTRSSRGAKPRRRRHRCAGKTSRAILELLGPLSRWSGLLALELLARLLGPLLKFVLQLLLLFLEL